MKNRFISYEEQVNKLMKEENISKEEAERILKEEALLVEQFGKEAEYFAEYFSEMEKIQNEAVDKHNVKQRHVNQLIKNFNESYPDLSSFNFAGYLREKYNAKEELDIDLMQYIFTLDIDLNSINAFMYGLLLQDSRITRLFMEYGVDVNKTMLYKGDKEKYLNSMEGKPESRYPADFREEITISPLEVAFANMPYTENIILLIENGADVNRAVGKLNRLNIGLVDHYQFPLDIALDYDDTNLVKLLLDHGADVNAISSIILPVSNGNFELISMLITAGYKYNEKQYDMNNDGLLSMCAHTIKKEYIDIAKLLIENGASVDEKSKALMRSMNSKDDKSFFRIRLNVKSDMEINTDMVILLLENGADANFSDADGNSVLLEGCKPKIVEHNERLNIIKLLIEHGADVNHSDNRGNTALMVIDENDVENYDGEQPVGFEGRTFVHQISKIAEVYSSENIINLLLDNGANIDARNKLGMTALMQHAFEGKDRLVKILIDRGADINFKSEMTAFDLAKNDTIKKLIKSKVNHAPQKLVKLLKNFTIDKPIKYTTHTWDFGELKKEYVDFDGYMQAVQGQFANMKTELEELSPNLYKKVHTFLLQTSPDESYSWCSQADINIGWSSLDGLKEWCDDGKNPFEFKLQRAISRHDGSRVRKFGDVIDLFKQEIEIRRDFKTLDKIFVNIGKNLDKDFSLTTSNLNKQFYTDVEQFKNGLHKIFEPIKKHKEFKNIEVMVSMPEYDFFELTIIHLDSTSTLTSQELLKEVEDGDFAEIKQSLTNLCDWSIEGSFADENFRVNYLKSNNVKDIQMLDYTPKGFTHILKFYK